MESAGRPGAALTILPLLFLRHLEYAAWRIGAFLGPDLFYERLRMGELPSLFVGSSPELLLAETAQGLGRWVFWAAAGLIVLFAALLLRRIRALHSRTGKLLALSAFLPLFLQAAIYWLYNLGWWPLGVLSLPFLSYGVFFLLVDAALAGVLLSVFRMDALLRDTAWASSARPPALRSGHPPGPGTAPHRIPQRGATLLNIQRRPAVKPQASFFYSSSAR